MRRKKKALVLAVCALLSIAASVFGTYAYLTSQDTVVNTFTVGQIGIVLDEAKVNPQGKPLDEAGNEVAEVEEAARVKGNRYHLVPGQSYVKDPTLTVIKGGEEAYVRMLVTISCYSALQDICNNAFLPQNFVEGWDNSVWVSTMAVGVDEEADTATYEFRYHDVVNHKDTVTPGTGEDLVLDALFDSFTLPGDIDGEELASINELEITVVGHAIQAAGFADADRAWAAFDAEINN